VALPDLPHPVHADVDDDEADEQGSEDLPHVHTEDQQARRERVVAEVVDVGHPHGEEVEDLPVALLRGGEVFVGGPGIGDELGGALGCGRIGEGHGTSRGRDGGRGAGGCGERMGPGRAGAEGWSLAFVSGGWPLVSLARVFGIPNLRYGPAVNDTRQCPYGYSSVKQPPVR
jgi:hypothetical protein